MNAVEKFKSEFDLVSYCDNRIGVQRMGRFLFTRCPFHDDNNPSMMVTQDGCYCFVCGQRFDAIEMVSKLEGKTFLEVIHGGDLPSAPRRDRPKYAKAKPYRRPSVQEMRRASERLYGSDYYMGALLQRGITEDSVRSRMIGLAKPPMRSAVNPRIVFPSFSRDGVLVSASYRRIDGFPPINEYPENKKYLVYPGAEVYLYGMETIKQSRYVVYTGGQIDSISMAQVGYTSIGAMGEGTFKEKWKKDLNGLSVVVALDNDDAGKIASEKVKSILGDAKIMEWEKGTEGMDINDLYTEGESGVSCIKRMVTRALRDM